jgi:hypothetical protein
MAHYDDPSKFHVLQTDTASGSFVPVRLERGRGFCGSGQGGVRGADHSVHPSTFMSCFLSD